MSALFTRSRALGASTMLALWLFAPANASADTILTGGNIINQTWTVANSPYIVRGDVTVPAGATLTIQAGVEVRFASSDAQASNNTTKAELLVDGALEVNGTAGSPVLFKSETGTTRGSWGGLVFRGASVSSVQYATILYGIQGVTAELTTGTLALNNTRVLESSQSGALVRTGAITLTDSELINNNGSGLTIEAAGGATATRTIFARNSQYGVSLTHNSSSSRTTTLDYTTIHANTYEGVYLSTNSTASATLNIKNSLVTQNAKISSSNYGIRKSASTGSVVNITNTDIWDNGTTTNRDVLYVTPGTGCISTNPIYADAGTNLRLTSNSPARFGSDTMLDMGALAYTNDATPGLYGVLWQNTTLSAANSPYTVAGDLSVPPGVTLTIPAGVTLTFTSNSDIMKAGDNLNRAELVSQGALNITGTANQRVFLRSSSLSSGSWYGVRAEGMGAVTAAHAVIEYANYGVEVDSTGAVSLSNTQIARSSQDGIYVRSGSVTTTDSDSSNNSASGLRIDADGGASTTRTIFARNSQYGVSLTHNASSSKPTTLDYATIHANTYEGVYLSTSSTASATLNIKNSLVTQNARISSSNYGIRKSASTGSVVNITNTDIWDNGTTTNRDVLYVTPGNGCISTNPIYVDTNSNLRLTSNSPARFGSNTAMDMGALAYVNDATPGLYGTLWQNTTLSAANSPYTVAGDLSVPPGVTLTIPAGVTLTFTSNADIMKAGDNLNRAELVSQGALNIAGTANQRVFLRSSSLSSGSWYGVRAEGMGAVTAAHAVIEYANYGVEVDSTGAVSLSNTQIARSSQDGIYVRSGSVTTTDSDSSNNSASGLRIDADGGANTTRTIFARNSQYGVSLTHNASSSKPTTLDYATIHANTYEGVYLSTGSTASATLNIKNSLVTQNAKISSSNYGIRKSSSTGSVVNITNTDIWDNGTTTNRDVLYVTPGTGCISTNPIYVDTSSNLRLTSNSPARFGSDTMLDMGALAYTNDATPGLYGVLWQNTTLSAANSPYTVAGDLGVPSGVTLNIPAGVTLTFTSNADIMKAGDNLNRAELRVAGSLQIAGQAGSPVVLTSSSGSAGSWGGVALLAGAASSSLRHVVIERAINGVDIDTLNSVTVQDATITQSSTNGIFVHEGTPVLDSITLLQNATGLNIDATAGATLTNAIVASNSQYGIYMNVNASSNRTTTLINDTIHGNTYEGIYISISSAANSATMIVKNTHITQNAKISSSNYGFRKSSSSAMNIDLSYSNLWDNGTTTNRNSLYIPAGTSMFSANPQYQAVAGNDFRLTAGSVMIDVGTGQGAPTRDRTGNLRPFNGDGLGGAEWDIGAHEYVPAQVCGNGQTEPGEQCDDGANNGMHGFCKADCSGQGPRCGDSIVNGPETCDDGAMNGQYGRCAANCLSAGPRCGDGLTNGPEACDDGAMNGQYNKCNASCTAQGPRCGDGMTNGPETCDDGAANGQYNKCNATCSGAGLRCGDGMINGNEVCDDGALNGQYGQCNAACTAQGGRCGDGIVNGPETCDDGAANGQYNKCNATCSGAGLRCGDGVVNGNEQCDDGNMANDDGCLNTCVPARCGDGVVQAGVESCDDGNSSNADACLNTCVAARCGDGVVQAGVEACDDGNMIEDDGCTTACRTASCGNGITDAGEECDDGNMSNTDTCLNTCLRASCGDGYLQIGVEVCDDGNTSDTDECLTTCRRASCGDGFVQDGVEACDDGNDSFTDACLPTCAIAVCGDGYVEAGEEACDDSNLDDGDGCSAMCEIEDADMGMGDMGMSDMDGADMGMDDMDAADMDAVDMPITMLDMEVEGDMDAADMDGADMSTPVPGKPSAEEDGCGCVTVNPTPRTPAAALVFGLLGLFAVTRRRRRA